MPMSEATTSAGNGAAGEDGDSSWQRCLYSTSATMVVHGDVGAAGGNGEEVVGEKVVGEKVVGEEVVVGRESG